MAFRLSRAERASSLIFNCSGLNMILADGDDFDEVSVRRYLTRCRQDTDDWNAVLSSISGEIFREEDLYRDPGVVSDFECFVNTVLVSCVEGELVNHLVTTLDWLEDVNEDDVIMSGAAFKDNHEAMIRACHRGDVEMTDVLFGFGFRIHSLLEKLGNEGGSVDIIREMTRLEAKATAVYLLAEAKFGDGDPVTAAFALLNAVRFCTRKLPSFGDELVRVSRRLEKFTVRMLDLCSGGDQVELLLDQDDGIEGVSIGGGCTVRPRIYAALQLKHKRFVTHSRVQQAMRKTFYHEGYDSRKERSFLSKLVYFVVQMSLTPLFAICHIARKVIPCSCEEKEEGTWSFWIIRNFDVPVNRLVSHVGSYLFFLALVILIQVNPLDDPSTIDLSFYDILAGLWAMAYIIADMEIMAQKAMSGGARRGPLISWRRVKIFFSNSFFSFRIASHTVFSLGLALEGIGYQWYQLEKSNHSTTLCDRIDDPACYEGFHLINLGNSLEGVGLIMIMTYIFHLFRLSPEIGVVYVALQKCIRLVASFFLTYCTISMAFALGLHFILRNSDEVCSVSNGWTVFSGGNDGNGSRYFRKLEVEINCEGGGNGAVSCSSECWDAFARNPTDKSKWGHACIDNITKQEVLPRFVLSNSTYAGISVRNRFYRFNESLKTTYWSLFNPGLPEVVGCSEGAYRYTALGLWAIYNIITYIVLLNLLIALMSATMSKLQEDKIVNWKFHRTQLWMEYCNRSVLLPAPFNLVDLIIRSFGSLCHCCCKRDKVMWEEMQHVKKAEYLDLIKGLVNKYISNVEEDGLSKDAAATAGLARNKSRKIESLKHRIF